MAIKRKRVVRALVAMTSLRSISGQSTSKRAQRKLLLKRQKNIRIGNVLEIFTKQDENSLDFAPT